MDESTQDDVATALRIAGELIDAGIPVFAAPPCPSGPFGEIDGKGDRVSRCTRPGHGAGGVEYDLPARWQQTVPSRMWLEMWEPGWALAAVGGWAADFLDIDPRNGGNESFAQMSLAGHMPNYYGVQATPSGGWHHLISPTGERKAVGFLPGLDLQAGDVAGQGRGFVWIAPTVKRSKTDGVVRTYCWTQEPDFDWLAEFSRDPVTGASADGSIEGLRLRVAAARERRADGMKQKRERDGSRPREFTPGQMLEFLAPLVTRVEKAQIGEIEEQANALACALSHFVPSMLTEDQAYTALLDALGETAYDPAHPASGWEASKFVAVISDVGGRAPGDWHAVQASDASVPGALQEAVAAVDVSSDEVSALLAEMLPPSVLAEREPPRYMIKGLLSYDSETWLIGGPGSKKSFVALDMAAHVALGKDWQGHRVNQGVALLIIGEGAGSIGKRIKAWQQKYGPMPDEGLRILPRPVQAADVQAWAVLVQACARLRAALDPSLGMFVVVDTQARSTVGLDENSAEEMGVYVNALAAIRTATGGCVMSVHHTTKTGSSTRGSGAQDGAQYSRLLMRSEKGSLISTLISDKQKDLEEEEPIELRFEKVAVGQDCDGEAIDSLVLTPRDAWTAGQVDGSTIATAEQEALREVMPFEVRAEPQEWTHRLTSRGAENERWLLQALADAGHSRGMTQAEWRDLVATKIGKLLGPQSKKKTMETKSWREPFQHLTDATHPARVAEVLVQVTSTHWTVDPVALQDFIAKSD